MYSDAGDLIVAACTFGNNNATYVSKLTFVLFLFLLIFY